MRKKVLQLSKKLLKSDGVFPLMDIEATDDPIDNDGPLNVFKLGISLHFCMITAMWQGGKGMGTVGLTPSVLKSLCDNIDFKSINKMDVYHPLNSLYEIE